MKNWQKIPWVLFVCGVFLITDSAHAQYRFSAYEAFQTGEQAFQRRAFGVASEWFYIAALQNDVRSQYRLGQIYQHFRSGDHALKSATYWFDKAARLSYAPAQYEMGRRYLKGHGVRRNPEAALTYLQRSARQGYIPAAEILAQIMPARY